MNTTHTTNCTRCGKPRIISKSWTETRETRVGTAVVAYSSFVCSDPECQKIVEAGLSREQEVRVQNAKLREMNMHRRSFTSNIRPK